MPVGILDAIVIFLAAYRAHHGQHQSRCSAAVPNRRLKKIPRKYQSRQADGSDAEVDRTPS